MEIYSETTAKMDTDPGTSYILHTDNYHIDLNGRFDLNLYGFLKDLP